MSPQFVDFDADGRLDIVAGTFDGSPHIARGTAHGWQQPVHILDRNGQRILLNSFWSYDTKKWETTSRCNAPDHALGTGHLTSAVAMDWDANGVLDLLLGDHSTGHIYRRMNEGTAAQPAFATTNIAVEADGKPIDVPGTVATMRLVDWNGDGRQDLLCGGMGYSNGGKEGGGVYLYLDEGTKTSPVFAAPIVLVPSCSKPDTGAPMRPDEGIYMDLADCDGDGDLDLVVGGYSHWKPKAAVPSPEEKRRLEGELAAVQARTKDLDDAYAAAAQGLSTEKKIELLTAQKPERAALGKQREALEQRLDPPPALVHSRRSYVWLYENVSTTRPAKAKAGGD